MRTSSGSRGTPLWRRISVTLETVKRWAWRGTCAYVWIKFVAAGIGIVTVELLEAYGVDTLLAMASYFGVQPVSRPMFGTVLAIAWVLTIAGFSIFQLVGLGIYLVLAPFAFLFLFVFKRLGGEIPDDTKNDGRSRFRPPIASFSAFSLAAWFVLYGGATTSSQIVPGVVFSGVLFVVLSYRSFLRVRPTGRVDMKFVNGIKRFALSALETTGTTFDRVPLDRMQLGLSLLYLRVATCLVRRSTLWLRGPSGQIRVHLLVALDYLWSLLGLVAAAIVFWGCYIAVLSPATALSIALQSSASRILPGFPMPRTVEAEAWWIAWGLSTTAWLLLILFIGPAASLLPVRQQAYSKRIAEEYALLRRQLLILKRMRRSVMRAIDLLGQQQKQKDAEHRESTRVPGQRALNTSGKQGEDRKAQGSGLEWD